MFARRLKQEGMKNVAEGVREKTRKALRVSLRVLTVSFGAFYQVILYALYPLCKNYVSIHLHRRLS